MFRLAQQKRFWLTAVNRIRDKASCLKWSWRAGWTNRLGRWRMKLKNLPRKKGKSAKKISAEYSSWARWCTILREMKISFCDCLPNNALHQDWRNTNEKLEFIPAQVKVSRECTSQVCLSGLARKTVKTSKQQSNKPRASECLSKANATRVTQSNHYQLIPVLDYPFIDKRSCSSSTAIELSRKNHGAMDMKECRIFLQKVCTTSLGEYYFETTGNLCQTKPP